MNSRMVVSILFAAALLLAACGDDTPAIESSQEGDGAATSEPAETTESEDRAGAGDDESTTGSGSTATADDDEFTTTTASSADSGPEDGQTRLWILPELVDCQGVTAQTCMQIAESENGDHQLFYDTIEGFTFAQGTSYVIDVTIEEVPDPPEDASSLRYTLVTIVEEIEEES